MKQELVGHRPQILQLESDLSSGNLAHAYLFVGPQRVGKFAVAKWFAKKIMTMDVRAAEKEEVGRRIDALIHPDVLVLDKLWMEETQDDYDMLGKYTNLAQQHRAKAKMKTDVISIDDVRQLQDRIQETGQGRHRVCLIRSVERMRDEAANAFLKTLEEPPPGRVFILTAEGSGSVLPTISSRARLVRFERVGDKDMKPMLTGLEPDEARFILHIAQGSPGTAVRLRDDADALREEKQMHEHARGVWAARGLGSRLRQLKPLFERGPQAERFLTHLALSLREWPGAPRGWERVLMQMVRDLETNAHRQLIVQRFALGLGEAAEAAR